MLCAYSSLSEEQLGTIHTLEKDLGRQLLAFSCHDMAPARLSEAELARIQKLEKELGIVLVAL
jgi:hypothetical protein